MDKYCASNNIASYLQDKFITQTLQESKKIKHTKDLGSHDNL